MNNIRVILKSVIGKSGEKLKTAGRVLASIIFSVLLSEQLKAKGKYKAVCVGPVEACRPRYIELRDGIQQAIANGYDDLAALLKTEIDLIPLEEKWATDFRLNVVTDVGKIDMLDKYFAGSAYTASWFMLLISATSYTTGPAAGDTMASHGGWAEDQNYAAATRPAPSWNAASAGSKATTATSYSINNTTTIKGAALNTISTKGGTSGTLFSAGLFAEGDKPVSNGDTLNVTWTGSLT